ncbi:hypothetical protein evm_009961 [Chilo suppressalis]|nr:hypothetical protein evm_009961 [Chilo suppressalis]
MPRNIREELEKIAPVSVEGMDRFIRAHGQTLKDISLLRHNKFPRIPDAVIWPETHEQVVEIVECASRHRFVIIPFGGGTSVSGAVTCPSNERRPILVLDTSEMNSILWLDKEQLLARVQSQTRCHLSVEGCDLSLQRAATHPGARHQRNELHAVAG